MLVNWRLSDLRFKSINNNPDKSGDISIQTVQLETNTLDLNKIASIKRENVRRDKKDVEWINWIDCIDFHISPVVYIWPAIEETLDFEKVKVALRGYNWNLSIEIESGRIYPHISNLSIHAAVLLLFLLWLSGPFSALPKDKKYIRIDTFKIFWDDHLLPWQKIVKDERLHLPAFADSPNNEQ